MATLTAIIAVPMLYNYMQHVQSSLQTEVMTLSTPLFLMDLHQLTDFRSTSADTARTVSGTSMAE